VDISNERSDPAFAMLVLLGDCDPQVKGHVTANLHVGNDRGRLIEVVTQLLPCGYPCTLHALRVIDEVTPSVIADTNQEQP
jgi:4-carboxymuconolactone decarboxylase